MKLKVKTRWWKILFKNSNGFAPIKVTMELESPEEARTMFHILNHCDLGDVVANKYYYGNTSDGKIDSEYSKKLGTLNCGKPNEQHLVMEMNKQNVSPMANGHLEYR